MSIIWKDAIGYEGIYSVSTDGNINRLQSKYCRQERPVTQTISRRGYMRVKLSMNGITKMHSVHKLVYESFFGKIPEYMTINHIDCNKLNNALENLECCTRELNSKLAKINGRISLSNAKITSSDADKIRSLKISGAKSIDIATKFGLSKRQVNRIVKGNHWTHQTNTSRALSSKDFL